MYIIIGSVIDNLHKLCGLLLLPQVEGQGNLHSLKAIPVSIVDALTLASEGQIQDVTVSNGVLVLDENAVNSRTKSGLKNNGIPMMPYLEEYLRTKACFYAGDILNAEAEKLVDNTCVEGQLSKPVAISLNYLMRGNGKVVADFSFYSPLELTKTDKETIKNELKKMFSCSSKQDITFGKISYSNYFTLTLRFELNNMSFLRKMNFLRQYGVCVSTAMYYTYDMSATGEKLMPLEVSSYHRVMEYFNSLRSDKGVDVNAKSV